MKATIGGVTVEGTPEELRQLLGIVLPNYHGIPITDLCMHDFEMNSTAPTCRKCGALYQPASPVAIVSQIAAELSEIPNVNITPHGRICAGGMRFC